MANAMLIQQRLLQLKGKYLLGENYLSRKPSGFETLRL